MNMGDYPTLQLRDESKKRKGTFIAVLYFTVSHSRIFNNEYNSYSKVNELWPLLCI